MGISSSVLDEGANTVGVVIVVGTYWWSNWSVVWITALHTYIVLRFSQASFLALTLSFIRPLNTFRWVWSFDRTQSVHLLHMYSYLPCTMRPKNVCFSDSLFCLHFAVGKMVWMVGSCRFNAKINVQVGRSLGKQLHLSVTAPASVCWN